MSKPLEGKRIAILLTDGVEQSELTEPRKALEKAGAKTILISPAANTVQAMKHKEKGDTFKVDIAQQRRSQRFRRAVVARRRREPGRMRTNADAVSFVRTIFDIGKPIAAICHGP